MKKSNSILILAGEIKSLDKANYIREYLLNIGNSLAFQRILKTLQPKSQQKIYLALNNYSNSFFRLKPFNNVQIINVGLTNSIVDTINIALFSIRESNIQILPITTIPDNKSINYKSCCFSDKSIPKENWSSITYVNKSKVEYFFKNELDSYGLNSFPFTGRIFVNKFDLKNVIDKLSTEDRKDLMKLAQVLISDYKYEIKHEKWYDIGHKTTYLETKISSITSRHFNNLKYNKKNNSIIKKSENKEKLFNEYCYYENLPLDLKKFYPIFFPRKFKKIKKEEVELELEFISHPNLAELYLFKSLGPNAWIRIINSIHNVFNEIYNSDKVIEKGDFKFLYSLKLKDRIREFKNYLFESKNLKLNNLFYKNTIINGQIHIKSIKETVDDLLIDLLNYEKSIKQYIGHGDLCFNNILVDDISGSVKLIDPKSFYSKNHNIWGLMDSNYDLAKLNHSFKYLYDSVVNDMFYINYEDDKIDLKIYAPKDYEIISNLFENKILKNNIEPDLLRKLTSNLFLSMLPIHLDDVDRVAAFAIIGSIIFNKYDFKKLIINI